MYTDNSKIKLFKDEAYATLAFKEFRLLAGINCKKCGGGKHYWLDGKKQFQCSTCRFRTTLKSGSVLEGSKLPIHYIILAAYLFNASDGKLSAEEFQNISQHKYFEPIWDFTKRLKVYFDQAKTEQLLNLYYKTALIEVE